MRKTGDTRELSVLYRDLRLLRRQFDLIKLGYLRKDYDPSQPRVPAGSPRGGEWSRIGLPVIWWIAKWWSRKASFTRQKCYL